MIENIELKNLKVNHKLSLNIQPLTVLTGLNGAGKSTSMQALGLLRQSYEKQEQLTGLSLNGSLVHLGKWSDVHNENATDEFIEISIKENGFIYYWQCADKDGGSFSPITQKPKNTPKFVESANFQYLQADRLTPNTFYPQAPNNAGFLGVGGEYTADYLALHAESKISEKRWADMSTLSIPAELAARITQTAGLVDQVAGWLQFLSPGTRLRSERISGTDETLLQFSYNNHKLGLSKQYRPTNVGFGLTYSLPIIVACLAAPKDSLLLLENPEAHLHPRGQAALGELLARCAADGVQIIVETHSDHLLNGIRLATKQKLIDANDVVLHFFTRSIETGEASVESPRLLPNGRLSSWPDGFFDQWDKSLDALLDD